jgi:hypothetical protein
MTAGLSTRVIRSLGFVTVVASGFDLKSRAAGALARRISSLLNAARDAEATQNSIEMPSFRFPGLQR